MAKPVFVLIDCNNFFVSCERVFRPDLADKPVAVLSNNDGCIVARSNEVKALSVPMGAPEFKWRPILRANRVQLFSANFGLYGDFSRRVVEILGGFTPDMEVYSVDESFLEVSTLLIEDYSAWAKRLRAAVLKQIGIPVSVGVAPTKTLAKAAVDYAKLHPETGGTLNLQSLSESKQLEILDRLPLEEVWGIGRRLASRLNGFGLRTAGDLARVSSKWARQHLTVRGEKTVRELGGESCFPLALEGLDHEQKSLAVTRSFGRNLRAIHELEKAMATFAARAATRLRRKKQIAGGLAVFIRTGVGAARQFGQSTSVVLPYPTSDTSQITAAALQGLKNVFNPDYAYRKAGVVLLDLKPITAQQTVFEQIGQGRQLKERDELMTAIDKLNRKYGTDTVKTAAQGAREKEQWTSQRKRVSPAYTTSWAEIPILA
jgi:DNA polymerase V